MRFTKLSFGKYVPKRSLGTRDLCMLGKLPDSGIGPCDTEFLHAVAQCVGVEAEDLGGAAGAVDDPVGLLENGEDVVVLHGFQRLADRTRSQMNTIVGLTRPCPRS